MRTPRLIGATFLVAAVTLGTASASSLELNSSSTIAHVSEHTPLATAARCAASGFSCDTLGADGSQVVAGPSPIGHWTGDNTTTDSSGFGRHGAGAVTYVPGRVGNAFDMRGGTHVIVPADGTIGNLGEMTLAAFVRPDAIGAWQTVATIESRFWFEVSYNGGMCVYPIYSYQWRWNAAAGEYQWTWGGPEWQCTASNSVAGGSWTHVALVRRLATGSWHAFDVYIDGVLQHPSSTWYSPTSIGTTLRIGARSDTYDPFVGGIDDARLYDVGLTPAHIAALAGQAP